MNIIATTYMHRNIYEYEQRAYTFCQLGITRLRVNWTRFSEEEYYWQIENYRAAYRKYGVDPQVYIDFPYPGKKNRVFFESTGKYTIHKGKKYNIYFQKDTVDLDSLFLVGNNRSEGYRMGEDLVIGDGEITFQIDAIFDDHISVVAQNSGAFSLGKSISSEQYQYDKSDSGENLVSYLKIIDHIQPTGVFLSFCEDVSEITPFKKKYPQLSVYPKIETKRAVNTISELLPETNGAVLGRGDLGVCNSLRFGQLQECAIKQVVSFGKEMIVATGILDSIDKGISIPSRSELTEIFYLKSLGVNSVVVSSYIAKDDEKVCRLVKYINNI